MGSLLSLFGGDNVILNVIVALAAVLVLIILGVWALKLVFNATGRAWRGQAKRLGIVDISPVDQKRKLVLVRRDNVEHLLLIGGSQDLVVESGIAVEQSASRPNRPMGAPQQQPSASAPPVAPATTFGAQRARRSNLPPDLTAMGTSTGAAPARSSLRHTALVQPSERNEPDFFPSPPQPPSSPETDSDKQADTEPVPTDTGTGSDEPDYGGEPNLEPDVSKTRSDETQQDR